MHFMAKKPHVRKALSQGALYGLEKRRHSVAFKDQGVIVCLDWESKKAPWNQKNQKF